SMALGFVAGVTTNPTILAREGRPASEQIPELLKVCHGTVFHQLRNGSLDAMRAEAEQFNALAPQRLALKIPCTLTGLALVARLSPHIACAVTAIFSPAQVLLASEAGARYVIPYVNRSTRLLGDGIALVEQMAHVCAHAGGRTQIIAASLKSADEVVQSVLHGAQHVTVPFELLHAMGEHPLSQQAIEEFERAR
ncbi:MAG: transaldolase, partial [Chloroflexi bacterium]|nr:transaldolase [Chloroflexota bacterium]